LPEAMNQCRYLVPRLTRQQLRQAIEGISSIIREVKAYMWESCHYQRKRA
jgi:hypothetical protein